LRAGPGPTQGPLGGSSVLSKGGLLMNSERCPRLSRSSTGYSAGAVSSRLLLGLLLGWAGLGLPGGASSAKELTPEKRQELQDKAQELNAQGVKHYQQGRYA